jgi:uncharacterized protein (UPF0264 family)
MTSSNRDPGLLVSVRSAEEAAAALDGGADLIDVKEPARGALGRADDEVIAAVVAAVAGRRPVSAALGELADGARPYLGTGLTFVKWGLAGCRRAPSWRERIRATTSEVVLVAYADWQCAQAPPLEEVVALAEERPGGVLLIDTHCKTAPRPGAPRPTLLDWLGADEVKAVCRHCRARGVRVALAGSIGEDEIVRLAAARPDWFAARGAVCDGGERDAAVCREKVRRLADVIRRTSAKASRAG